MILQDIKELKTSAQDLRKFGLLVGGVFAVLGLVMWMRHKAHYPWFLAPGIALMVFGAVLPRVLKPVYIAWMSMAIVLGFVVSNVILTLFFAFVITGIGLAARLFGKDFLGLRLDRGGKSYWIPRRDQATRTPAEYERQF